jgi:hypothetical protein
VAIERGVDLAAIEILGEELNGMLLLLQSRWIDDSLPVLV